MNHEYSARFAGDRRASQVQEELAGRLLSLYKDNQVDGWKWFEDKLTYCNAAPSHAMLLCGESMSNQVLSHPERCLKRGDEWAFGPEEDYELHGDVDKVVFPCGYTLAPDGDTICIYYGAEDTSIAMATGSVQKILQWLK